MITIKNSIAINTPISKVFDFFSTPENFPRWNYYVISVRKMSSGNGAVGSRYHQVRKNDEQIFEITKFERNKLVTFSTVPDSSIRFLRQMNFRVLDEQCLLDDLFELDAGFPMILQKLFTRRIKQAVYENLVKSKELLETGKTVLQDGRISYYNIEDVNALEDEHIR